MRRTGRGARHLRTRPRAGRAIWVFGLLLVIALGDPGTGWAADAQGREGSPVAEAGATAESMEESHEYPDCDPREMICIDVFEDDPESVTARWDGVAKVWVVEPPSGYVRVRHKGDTVTSRRLLLQEEEEHARLEEDVVVEREDMRGRSRTLDLWWEQEEYLFVGDVEIVQFEDGATARTLWADQVRYWGETENVTATGQVRMVDDQYRVWAREMVYRKDPKEEMTFTGQVRVQSADPEWTMTGERFEYDVETEQGRLVGPHRIELTPRD